MKEIDPNKPIKRTTRMYEASPEEYAACIRQALKSVHSGHLNPNSPAGQSNNNAA